VRRAYVEGLVVAAGGLRGSEGPPQVSAGLSRGAGEGGGGLPKPATATTGTQAGGRAAMAMYLSRPRGLGLPITTFQLPVASCCQARRPQTGRPQTATGRPQAGAGVQVPCAISCKLVPDPRSPPAGARSSPIAAPQPAVYTLHIVLVLQYTHRTPPHTAMK
jgi:hypothetical protein